MMMRNYENIFITYAFITSGNVWEIFIVRVPDETSSNNMIAIRYTDSILYNAYALKMISLY